MSSSKKDAPGASSGPRPSVPDLQSLAAQIAGDLGPLLDDPPPEAEANAGPPPPGPPPPTAAAPASADEEAETNEYRAVPARELPPRVERITLDPAEQRATNPYNPSVSTLVKRLEAPEVAPEEDPNLGPMRSMIVELTTRVDELKRIKDSEPKRLIKALEEARGTMQATADLLGKLPADVEALGETREELLRAYVGLQRAIEARTRKPEPIPAAQPKRRPPAEPEGRADAPAEEAPPRRADEVRESLRRARRRVVTLVVVVALLGLGRIALLGSSAPTENTEQGRSGAGVQSVNHLAGATEDELARGAPSVMEVYVSQERDGTLRARALGFDPDGDEVTLSFRWMEDGKLREVGEAGELPAEDVRAGATYEVQVIASDGKNESRPLASPPFVPQAGGSGASQ